MKTQIICTACVALVAILGVTGCASTGKDERSEGRTLDDEKITDRIRESLEEEPVYKFSHVDVNTFAGQVQLSGFVNTEEQKQKAGQIASSTPGVVTVHNALVLKPMALSPTGRTNTIDGSVIYSEPPKQAPQQPGAPEQRKDNP